MNATVERLIHKMIYARAGGHEKEYQDARDKAEIIIRDDKIVSIINNLKKEKRSRFIDYGNPFMGLEMIETVVVLVGIAVLLLASASIVAVFVAGIRCLIKH